MRKILINQSINDKINGIEQLQERERRTAPT